MTILWSIVVGIATVLGLLARFTPWGRYAVFKCLFRVSSGCRVLEGYPRYVLCMNLKSEWGWIRNIRMSYRIRGRKAGTKDWDWTMQRDDCITVFPKPFVYDVVRNTNPGMAAVDSPEPHPQFPYSLESHIIPEGEQWEVEVLFFKNLVFSTPIHRQHLLVYTRKPDDKGSAVFMVVRT